MNGGKNMPTQTQNKASLVAKAHLLHWGKYETCLDLFVLVRYYKLYKHTQRTKLSYIAGAQDQ